MIGFPSLIDMVVDLAVCIIGAILSYNETQVQKRAALHQGQQLFREKEEISPIATTEKGYHRTRLSIVAVYDSGKKLGRNAG